MEVILSHNNSDLDAIASQLAAWKLTPEAVPVLAVRLNRDVSEFLALYGSGLPFVHWHDFRERDITRIILTDTHTRPSIKGANAETPLLIIEHHPQERPMLPNETWTGELIGAATTLLVEQIQAQMIALQPIEATLMALGIYSDTGMLTYANTTPRDVFAVGWLLSQGAHLDTIRKFLVLPLDEKQQRLYETMLAHTDTRTIEGYSISVCVAQSDELVDGINSVTRRVGDMLDATAIIGVVQMPRTVQLVARSADDALDVGALAQALGGGGHLRASAASIDDMSAEAVEAFIWDWLAKHVKPRVTVRDLMSYGAQTVAPDDLVRDIVARLRRIGHEGYPVVENGRVLGLLTRRDADRTLEHGLVQSTVREVMQSGDHSLSPDDSIATLENTMLETGWGQIPITAHAQVIGIVTRTDLLRHWVRSHPKESSDTPNSAGDQLEQALAAPVMSLVHRIGDIAQQNGLNAYLVGGVVRDVLLERHNHDMDFVIEGDAIAFAQMLAQTYGGSVNSFAPFGTAKWLLDASVAAHLNTSVEALPAMVDFATARNEFYAHPTALPTVYHSSIKLDLGRRDFTMNALAVQISPANQFGTLIDSFGGVQDIAHQVVRVLHSLSFVDDPTRILRAIRFATRYGFTIEPRTADLIANALPMLGRITGERLRNELRLHFGEAQAHLALTEMHIRGVDRAMHAALDMSDTVIGYVQRLHTETLVYADDRAALHWHLLLAACDIHTDFDAVIQRFLIPQNLAKNVRITAQLWQNPLLHMPERTSDTVLLLDDAQPITWQALWLMGDAALRTRIQNYVERWRFIMPNTDGNALVQRGIAPGPIYSQVLRALRVAWLDEVIHDAAEEMALLNTLLEGQHERL